MSPRRPSPPVSTRTGFPVTPSGARLRGPIGRRWRSCTPETAWPSRRWRLGSAVPRKYLERLLDRYDITLRRRRPVAERVPRQALFELYVQQGLTAQQVAAEIGFSAQAVLDALRRHFQLGPRRRGSAGRDTPLDPARVINLNVDTQLSTPAIAKRLGCSVDRIRHVLVTAGIARRSGVATFQVRRRLEELAITRPPPGRQPIATAPVEEIEELYVGRWLPFGEVGRRFGVAGIPTRARTTRATRRQLPVEEIRELYVERELTATEVAARIGSVTADKVLRSLHDHALPVRRAGTRGGARRRSEDLRLLRLLYAERVVQQFHHVGALVNWISERLKQAGIPNALSGLELVMKPPSELGDNHLRLKILNS